MENFKTVLNPMTQQGVISLPLRSGTKRKTPYSRLNRGVRDFGPTSPYGTPRHPLDDLKRCRPTTLLRTPISLMEYGVPVLPSHYKAVMTHVDLSENSDSELLTTPPPKTSHYKTGVPVSQATICLILSNGKNDEHGGTLFSQDECVTPRVSKTLTCENSVVYAQNSKDIVGCLVGHYTCTLPSSPQKSVCFLKRSSYITPQGTPHRDIYLKTPEAPRRRPRQKLLHAILEGNCQLVIQALQEGEDPNLPLTVPSWVLGEGTTLLPLLLASRLAYGEIVLVLLQYGAVLGSVNFQGRNALHLLFSNHYTRTSQHNDCENRASPRQDVDGNHSEKKRQGNVNLAWKKLEDYFQTLTEKSDFGRDELEQDMSPSLISTPRIDWKLPDLGSRFAVEHSPQQQRYPTKEEILSCAQILLRMGVDAYKQDIFGETPKDIGIRRGYWNLESSRAQLHTSPQIWAA